MCNAESQVSREEKSKLGAKCEMVGTVGAYHNGANGDFTERSSGSGFVEGLLHRFGGHGGVL